MRITLKTNRALNTCLKPGHARTDLVAMKTTMGLIAALYAERQGNMKDCDLPTQTDGVKLGRVLTHLEYLLEDEKFELPCRCKDFSCWFEKLSDEEKDEYLHRNAYFLENINQKLSECILIARGHD